MRTRSISGVGPLARRYYHEFLNLNPEETPTRLRVAHDLALMGDLIGAIELVKEGFKYDSANVQLYEQLGNFAFKAADSLRKDLEASRRNESGASGATVEVGGEDGMGNGETEEAEENGEPELSEEVKQLYREAIAAYEVVYAKRGAEAPAPQLTNTLAALIQLGELDRAISLGERLIKTHPKEITIREFLANAFFRKGDVDRAVGAIRGALEENPEHAGAPLAARAGKWLIDKGRLDEALVFLKMSEEREERPSDELAEVVLAYAFGLGQRDGKHEEAIAAIGEARGLKIGDMMKARLDFFHGYFLLLHGQMVHKPETVESARASLPIFKEAKQYLVASTPWAKDQPGINLTDLISNADQFIDVQEAIIKRGSPK